MRTAHTSPLRPKLSTLLLPIVALGLLWGCSGEKSKSEPNDGTQRGTTTTTSDAAIVDYLRQQIDVTTPQEAPEACYKEYSTAEGYGAMQGAAVGALAQGQCRPPRHTAVVTELPQRSRLEDPPRRRDAAPSLR